MTYAPNATGPFYHGTCTDLAAGELLAPGHASNYAMRKLSWIYFSGTLDAAIWGCELARGEGRERIYVVEPTGAFEDDPNLTDSDARRPAGGRSSRSLSRQPDPVLPQPQAAARGGRGRNLGAAPARAPRRDEGRARADGSRGRARDH